MLQRVVDGRFEIADFFAGVVPLAFEHVAVKLALLHELPQRVGELDLASSAAAGLLQNREDLRRQDIAADDRVVRRRVALRLLDHVRDVKPPPAHI